MRVRVTSPAAVVLALAATVALVLGALPGTAWVMVPHAGAQAAGASGEAASNAALAIIMDASSSMLQPDEGGTRLDVAKRAATDLVDLLPDTARVGMLAYGTQESDAP